MDSDSGYASQRNPFFSKLLLVMVFCHSSRNPNKTDCKLCGERPTRSICSPSKNSLSLTFFWWNTAKQLNTVFRNVVQWTCYGEWRWWSFSWSITVNMSDCGKAQRKTVWLWQFSRLAMHLVGQTCKRGYHGDPKLRQVLMERRDWKGERGNDCLSYVLG